MVTGVGHHSISLNRGALATTKHIQDLLPSGYDLVIWTHVDPGSNVHIVFDHKMLHNFRRTRNKLLGQVSGDKKPVFGVGEWHINIDQHNIVLHNVLCMPDNPTCTLSTGALKMLDGFEVTSHDALTKLHLVNSNGINVQFETKHGNMKNVNGLDYIPLVTILRPQTTFVSMAPNLQAHPDDGGYMSANAASITLRRSQRNRRPPLKLRQSHSSPPPSSTQHPPLSSSPPPTVITHHQLSSDVSSETSSINSPYLTRPTNSTAPSPLPSPSPSPPLPSHTSKSPPRQTPPKSTLHSINNIITHLKFGCRNMKNIIHMAKHKSIDKLPTHLHEFNHSCPICLKCKFTKIPRNPPLPTNMLKPGQMLQLDFAFFNQQSIRGFTSYLSCDCVHTKYSFRFCTRSKRAPIDVIRWIIETLRKQNKTVNYVRFDEGGELARNIEIPKMLTEEYQIIMQTTGGYASHLNGITERGHRTDADSIRSSLYAAGLSDQYWCFALMHSNFISRRWCRYPDTTTPYEKWNQRKPSFSKMHIFGATIYVSNHEAKKLDAKATTGLFLGYGASTAVMYYLDNVKNTIKRAHHAKVDNLQVGGNELTPGSRIIHKHANIANVNLPDHQLTISRIASPFKYETLFSYNVSISKTGPLGLNLEDDKVFGLPIINSMEDDSPFKHGCKKILQKNSWIIGIHHDEPITIDRFIDYIAYLRAHDILTFQITLTKRVTPAATNYAMFRNYFDNFRPIAAKATIITPEAKYAVQVPSKPITPKTWTDVINGDFKDLWYKAVYERYDKNHNVGLLSIPVPESEAPSNSVILRAVSAFKIKNTSHPNIYDFYFRMCADGSKQIKGLHFDESHSPTPAIWAILTCTCVAAALSLRAYTIDIDNAFQNTPRYPSKDIQPIFITCPPLYMSWFKSRFPNYQFAPKTKYIIQCFMNMQGLRTAGRDFHTLLRAILAEIDIHPTSVDNGIFILLYKQSLVLLAISTDDILIFTKHEEFFLKIKDKLHSAFGVTSQNGDVIHYLNYRIIQSAHGISIDQNKFILDIVHQYIPANSKCPKIDTPLRTDRQFDNEVLESTPASPKELKQLIVEFKAEYRTIFGQLCHIMKASRPDLSNAINRLGVFQCAPNRLAYMSIYRVLQYLFNHPNVPLIYPKQNFSSDTALTVHSSKGSVIDSLKIPHCLCGHVDISFAPYKEFRHSVGGHVETLNCVAIDWRTMKQTSCATSATDAETRQYYDAAKRTLRIRQFLRQIGLALPHASPILPSFRLNYEMPSPIFEDNKGTRDMLAAGKVTSNLKHVDIPLTYLHSLHESATITTSRANSATMVANFLTKQETGPQHIKSTKWITGRQYYPPRTSNHFKTLTQYSPLSML